MWHVKHSGCIEVVLPIMTESRWLNGDALAVPETPLRWWISWQLAHSTMLAEPPTVVSLKSSSPEMDWLLSAPASPAPPVAEMSVALELKPSGLAACTVS